MDKKAEKIVVTASAQRTIREVANAFTSGEINITNALRDAQTGAERAAKKLLKAGVTANMMGLNKQDQRALEIEFGGSKLTVLHVRSLIDQAMAEGLCKAGGIFGTHHLKAFSKPAKERTVNEAKDAKLVQQRLGVLRARLKATMGAKPTKSAEPKQPLAPSEKLLKQVTALINGMQKLETPEFDVTEACKAAFTLAFTIDPTFKMESK